MKNFEKNQKNQTAIIKNYLLSLLPNSFLVCDNFKDENNQKLENPHVYYLKRSDFKKKIHKTREISVNNSERYIAIVIDVDEEYNQDRIQQLVDKKIIPHPSWITVNKRSNKYHVVFLLNQSYKKKYSENRKLYNENYEYLSIILNGDVNYKGLWTHNPFHDGFDVDFWSGNVYSTYDLFHYTQHNWDLVIDILKEKENEVEVDIHDDIASIIIKKSNRKNSVFSRNQTIFLRTMSRLNSGYSSQDIDYAAFEDMKYYNRTITDKPELQKAEIQTILRSAKKYHRQNKNFIYYEVDLNGNKSFSYSLFSQKQKMRSKLGLKVRRENASQNIKKMQKLLTNGLSKQEIMEELVIKQTTYYKYLKIIDGINKEVLKYTNIKEIMNIFKKKKITEKIRSYTKDNFDYWCSFLSEIFYVDELFSLYDSITSKKITIET